MSAKDPALGEPRNNAAAFGNDLSLKLVVVVDNDVNVYDEQEVMWAVATRFQADTDLEVIRNAMGATLDPSNHDGTTAKLIIDATRKKRPYARRHSLPQASIEKAQSLIRRALGRG